MKQTIKKGSHLSFPPQIGYTSKVEGWWKFNSSCIYDLMGPDQADSNKLTGLVFTVPESCSARVGWRWSLELKKFELFAYGHDSNYKSLNSDGSNRYIGPVLARVKPNESFKVIVETIKGATRIEINGKSDEVKRSGLRWGWIANFYFGGNQTAPHEMYVECSSKMF